MVHTFSQIYLHIVWAVQNRKPMLQGDARSQLSDVIGKIVKDYDLVFVRYNIQPDHVHLMINVPTDIKVSDFMQKLKGSSSYILNRKFYNGKFKWNRGYGVFSVSPHNTRIVENYIKNQDKHHAEKTFSEEYSVWKDGYLESLKAR